jgi:hypothetical protein
MSNKLYNRFGNNNPYNGMINDFNKFAQNLKGNPQEQVQRLLNSGKISQAQYNQAVQKANALRQFFGV